MLVLVSEKNLPISVSDKKQCVLEHVCLFQSTAQ